jgi:glycosyltransferase involved in cell wall biosynthesis
VVVPTPLEEGGAIEAQDGALRIRRAFFREPRWLKREFTRAWAMRRPVASAVREIRKDFPFDVAVGFFLVPGGWLAEREARRYGVPTAVFGLGSDINLFPRHAVLGGMVRRTLRRAVLGLYYSQELRDHAVALGAAEGRSLVLPAGYDPAVFHPAAVPTPTRPVVVMSANLVPVKQPLVFVAALRELVAMGVDFEVEMAGDGYLRGDVERAIAQAGLADRVTLLGVISQGELADRFRRAAAVVLTSHSEGFGVSLLEALACGTPVVASDLASLREYVRAEENGLLVPVGDVKAVAAALRAVLTWPVDRERIAATVREFTWVRHGERFAGLLEEAMR